MRKLFLERLLADVRSDARRWTTLLDRWSNLGADRAVAMAQLRNTVKDFVDQESRTALRSKLRSVLHHNRSFPEADWSLPDEELAELEAVYEALTPADPVARASWLFEPSVSLPNRAGGWEKHDEQLRAERCKVAKAFVEEHGIDAVFALASAVRDGGCLGASLVESGVDRVTCEQILHRALKSENTCDHNLAHELIFALHAQAGQDWAQKLVDQAITEGMG